MVMKLIIAGSRGISNPYDKVLLAIDKFQLFPIDEVISGTARGIDKAGEEYANSRGIPLKKFPASWSLFGRWAGSVRNAEMAGYADTLLAIWDGQSKGTKNMIETARKQELKVHIYHVT